jgi:hypothetical protein
MNIDEKIKNEACSDGENFTGDLAFMTNVTCRRKPVKIICHLMWFALYIVSFYNPYRSIISIATFPLHNFRPSSVILLHAIALLNSFTPDETSSRCCM